MSELHLSRNTYSDTDIQQSEEVNIQHSKLTNLYLVENCLTQWTSIELIGEIFPNLVSLVLIANPLQDIVPTKETTFQSLQTLNLNESQVNLWESVENLRCYPQLKSVSLLRVPIGNEMMQKERRFSTIARLPMLDFLNKSIISQEERIDAERWLLREYHGHPSPPFVYQKLLDKHGHVQPLPQVSLEPKKQVSIKFTYEGIDREDEILDVDLMQTTRQFRKWIGRRLLVPPSKLRLYYCDIECMGMFGAEELRMESKELYTFRMRDGDRIEVLVKQ